MPALLSSDNCSPKYTLIKSQINKKMFCVLLLLVTKEEMKLIFKDADPKKQIIASPIKSIAISLTSTVECKNIYKPFHEYAF